jgi:anti-sigma regulatory factor (Ser/Thr protein kinase)
MAIAAARTTSLISFTLLSTPYSARIARFYIRAALTYHDLGGYITDAEMITSELVTNAMVHAGKAGFGIEVVHLTELSGVAVIVIDSSPVPPVRQDPTAGSEHGRGLNIVEALSTEWGWRPEAPGKVVWAILAAEA